MTLTTRTAATPMPRSACARIQTRDAGSSKVHQLRLVAVQLEWQDQGEIPCVEKAEFRGMTPMIWRAIPSTMMVLPTVAGLALYFRCQ